MIDYKEQHLTKRNESLKKVRRENAAIGNQLVDYGVYRDATQESDSSPEPGESFIDEPYSRPPQNEGLCSGVTNEIPAPGLIPTSLPASAIVYPESDLDLW
ncbi:hypothetical protein FOPE_08403 [Fonsecaea pedrosoi]|nr:hypothetical protein FOPE_08403 [Fonsecaea pedrosoi]